MLHQEMMYRVHRDDPFGVDRLLRESLPAEGAEPAFSPWALAASVAGNIIAGGVFLGALLLLPYWLSFLVV